jgi:hypothetical protein
VYEVAPFHQFDGDLIQLDSLARDNDNVKYLLCCVDVFTRKLYVRPLKNKTGKSIHAGLKDIFLNDGIPSVLRFDIEGGVKSKEVRKFLDVYGVQLFWAYGEPKASNVESVIKTIKNKISRYLFQNHTRRYIDKLQDIVSAYNGSPHSSLNSLTPNSITDANQNEVYENIFKPEHGDNLKLRLKKKTKYKVGQFVRVSRNRPTFDKGYSVRYSEEVFKIHAVFPYKTIDLYQLVDLKGKPIRGKFYAQQLTLTAQYSPDQLFLIEKIVKTEKRNDNLTYYLVKWQNYPTEENSWVAARDLVSYRP